MNNRSPLEAIFFAALEKGSPRNVRPISTTASTSAMGTMASDESSGVLDFRERSAGF